jgi:hypothetical protein
MPTATPQPSPTLSPTATPQPSPTQPPIGDDTPILGTATGSSDQAVAWLATHGSPYTAYDIGAIVDAYQRVGESVGMDWFMALAQMSHETGHLTSFWSLRPQRNPAGIGVTGEARAGAPSDPPPEPSGWAFNTQRNRWERGISFPTWADHAVPAHLGRLLAYVLRDEWAGDTQRALIQQALAWRGLPDSLRGSAASYLALNGRWAYPGTTYGQTIIDLARRMRGDI